MKNVLILQRSNSKLERLNESNDGKTAKTPRMGGIFTEFDVVNENSRVYTSNEFLPHLKSMNEKREKLGVQYGEFDHPENFETSLTKSSHIIEKADYIKESNNVRGEIRLLNTFWGKEAQAITNDGLPLFVSSRAAGTTNESGYVSIKKLFTYDLVADPGFSSAKMTNLNESLGFNKMSNVQIYDLTSQEKTNNLFKMNKNEIVTKKQLEDYSKYIKEELEGLKGQIEGGISNTSVDVTQLEELIANYENMQENQSKILNYLDYMAENVQLLKEENDLLKRGQKQLIIHNDHIVESVNTVINYTNYVGEKLDQTINYTNNLCENINKTIEFTDYLAETLDQSISFSNYLSETVNKNIEFSNYLSETLDQSIAFSSHIGETLEENIKFSNYLAENLDSNIQYSNYLAENLDNSIRFSDYLSENLESGIKYAEYLAENLDNSIKFSDYLAENLESGIKYAEYLGENLESSIKFSDYLAESVENSIAYTESVVDAINEANGLDVQALRAKDRLFEQMLDSSIQDATSSSDDMLTRGNFNPDVNYSAGGKFNPSNNIMQMTPSETIEAETKAFRVDDIVKINGTDKVGTILELDGIVAKVQLADSDEVVTISADQLTRVVDAEDTTPDYKDEPDYKDLKESIDEDFLSVLTNEQKFEYMCLNDTAKREVSKKINESGYYHTNSVIQAIREASANMEIAEQTESIFEKFAVKKY